MLEKVKLIKIGNSQGLRLPKWIISKYGFGNHIILEEMQEGILLRTGKKNKFSWEDTYKAMAETEEEWDDWQNAEIDAEMHL